jgi:hypothetical protein
MNPKVTIEFSYLPSWNDLLAVARYKFAVSALIKKWLLCGEDLACTYAVSQGIEIEDWIEMVSAGKGKDGSRKMKPLQRQRLKKTQLTGPLRLELHIWRADSRIFDCHNVCIKPLLDGMREARLFAVDDVNQIKAVSYIYEGIDRGLAQTNAERQQRKDYIAKAKLAEKRVKREPTRARYRLEFYGIADDQPESPLFAARNT